MDTAISYPAHFEFAVSPQDRFCSQIPLPTVGLLCTRIQTLLRRAAQGDAESVSRGDAVVQVRGAQNPGTVQRDGTSGAHAVGSVDRSHADREQTVTREELPNARAERETSRSKNVPGDAHTRCDHVVVVADQRAVLEERRNNR